mmetsp:Transcript_1816/g.2433  ORF Transcript_1816/g.2433 Transcript_1816/m.2433 type:complete len:308 (-) Transcript_1816:224-1147(-)
MSIIAALRIQGSPPFKRRPHWVEMASMRGVGFSAVHTTVLSNLYCARMCSGLTFLTMAEQKSSGFSRRSALTTPLRTESSSVSPAVSTTTPGQSMRDMRLKRDMYCHILVSPGMGATLHDFLEMRVLMTDDFPTLGYPTTPTLISFLSSWSLPNCRRRAMRAPFPKACVMLAWKAMVGRSLASSPIHRLATQLGTRSILLRIKTRCLCLAFLARCRSIILHLVPGTFRQSIMCRMTSEQSMTLKNSPQILLDCPLRNRSSFFSWRQSTPSPWERTRFESRPHGTIPSSALTSWYTLLEVWAADRSAE